MKNGIPVSPDRQAAGRGEKEGSKMLHTSKYNDGYRYYVYDGPGMISYFRTLAEATAYAEESGGRIGEVE